MPPTLRHLPNIEKSAESNTLWPPIADAIGTFIRRRSAQADGYELTWRIIHVWEAVATVLTSAAASRLRTLAGATNAFLRCREHLHGRTWDPLSRTFNRFQGALDGSATRRIDLLWDLDNVKAPGSRFLDSTKQFLKTNGLQLRALVDSWKQICDVPAEVIGSDQFTVREALRHVNTFRNRFAHVPFPYDEMTQLSATLAEVTEQLFSLDPKPWQCFPDERLESPLNGAIEYRSRRLRGKLEPQICDMSDTEPHFVYPAMLAKKNAVNLVENAVNLVEKWEAAPFLSVDSMFRPSILTRLISEANGVWEYTRFFAERNSVVRDERPDYLPKLQQPAANEYPVPDEEEQEEQVATSTTTTPPTPGPDQGSVEPSPAQPMVENDFGRALRQIANYEYEPAIAYFQTLVQTRPNYHIGWLRLGHAQRELAMRKRGIEDSEAKNLFSRSIEALTNAAKHSHLPRQAEALYERSKAHYHCGRIDSSSDVNGGWMQAMQDAEEAFKVSPETKYETWIGFLKQHRPALEPGPDGCD